MKEEQSHAYMGLFLFSVPAGAGGMHQQERWQGEQCVRLMNIKNL